MSSSEKDSVNETSSHAAPAAGLDTAWKYLNSHREDADAGSEPINLVALRRRIDFRIVPLMFLCYTLQFIDKVILNVSHPAPDDFLCGPQLISAGRTDVVCECDGLPEGP